MPSVIEIGPVLAWSSKDRSVRRFYPQLDGLRAVAISLVLITHCEDLKLPAALAYLASMGWIGVDAFFVLSGFLITGILLRSEPGLRAFGRFALRRTLRTWPLYFSVLFVAYLALRLHGSGEQVDWLQHVFFLQNYSPEFFARSLTPTWSLCVEEHFYLLWPFLIFFRPRRALPWTLSVLFFALPGVRYWGLHHAFTYKQLYTETQFHLDGLVAGSIVAVLISRYAIPLGVMIRIAYVCLILGFGTAFLGFWRNWGESKGQNVLFGFTSLAVAFAGLLLLLLLRETSLLGKVFSLGWMRYIGRISYGIYILNDGVIAILSRAPLHRIVGPVGDSWYFVSAMRIGLSICVAALSYRFFESPILRFKDRLR